MTAQFSSKEVLITVTRLTHSQLMWFIDCAFVKPEHGADGYVFGHIDIARLELLCDLSEDLDLDETGIGIVISLIDQLHAARLDCAAMADVIAAIPFKMRSGITAELQKR